MADGAEEIRPMVLRDSEAAAVKISSWFGTREGSWIWLNTTDMVGIIFGALVLIIFSYAVTVLIMLYKQGVSLEIPIISNTDFILILFFMFMAIWSHLATMCCDPGSIPWNAHPTSKDRKSGMKMSICGYCDSYKPPNAHHCRVSKRCIARMDHFCPWTNNAIGAGNQKNFILFLIYTSIGSIYMYVIIALNLVSDSITSQPLLDMSRVLLFILVFSILFTISMIFNQAYGISTGFGTIDRMKMKAADVVNLSKSTPILHVFGKFSIRWFLPLQPLHSKPDKVWGYSLKNYRYGQAV
jgi:palmitoyltransferase ZDHHC3/7/25